MKKVLALILSVTLVFPAAAVLAQYPGEEAGFEDFDLTSQIVFDDEVSEFGYQSYKFVDENGNEIQPQYDDIVTFADLPSYYRNTNLTPVKNQNEEGCCWAFAMIGAMEASLIKQGYHADRLDFSEAHMAYFSVNIQDSIHNDGPQSIGADAYSQGGNEYYALAAMAKGSGAVSESVAPYEEYTTNTSLGIEAREIDESKRFLCEAGIETLKIINPANTTAIKQAIMSYGSVLNTFYVGANYYNKNSVAYHYGDDAQPNHQTLIVGWDDDFAKENFNEDYQPENNGAWIVRNSWGEEFGKDGYFYISYETGLFSTSALKATYEEYDNNHGYTGGMFYNYADSVTVYSNTFTADSDEVLEAISFYAVGSAEVVVSVYKNTATAPSSGERVFAEGLTVTNNYNKITFPEGIPISEGEKYSIIIDGAVLCCEPTGENYTSNKGSSWVYDGDGWYYFNDISIRAHTNENKPKITAQIRNNKIEINSKYNNNSILYIAQYADEELVDIQIASEATLNTTATRYRVFSWDADMNSTTGYFVEDEI